MDIIDNNEDLNSTEFMVDFLGVADCQIEALVYLLINKGIFTKEEYISAVHKRLDLFTDKEAANRMKEKLKEKY